MTPARIKETVAEVWGISTAAIDGPCRDKRIVEGRHIAMWLTNRILGYSTPVIGQVFGDRHHHTVIHGLGRIQRRLNACKVLRARVSVVCLELGIGDAPTLQPCRVVAVRFVRGRAIDYVGEDRKDGDKCIVCRRSRADHFLTDEQSRAA